MKIAIVDIRHDPGLPENSAMVSMRNMVFLAKNLSADLVWHKNKIPDIKYDVIILGFGSSFSVYNESTNFIKSNPNAKIFWLVGEYEQSMLPAIHYGIIKENRKLQIIQNHIKIPEKKWIEKVHVLNINLILSRHPNKLTNKKYDCIYYSRWRPGRTKHLKEYLKKDIYFSTSTKNFKQHLHIGCSPKLIKKMSWVEGREELNNFRYSLYIEDEFTHTVFNNLANRWYESGFCNNVVFFDTNCWNTILNSEISEFKAEIKQYIVSDYIELQKKIKTCNKDFEKHLLIQKKWRSNEMELKEKMLIKFKQIIKCG